MKIIKLSLVVLLSTGLFAQEVDKMMDSVENTHAKSLASQKKIDGYSEEAQKLYSAYVRVEKELEEQKLYNRQLTLFVDTQSSEIPKLNAQLKEIVVTHKKIIPLMFEMVDTLEKFIQADTPFLTNERQDRVKNLKSYLANSEVSMAEQFRLILEAYKIEYSYARTLEVYRGQLENDESKTVDFLRLGRTALYYQSLDLKECALYDLEKREWTLLDPSYNADIQKAIKMARKKISPDFLSLPIITAKAN